MTWGELGWTGGYLTCIRKAGRLNENAVERPFPLHQPFDDPDQVASHGAADATIVHFKDFFLRIDDQVVIDADFAELVHDDGVSPAVIPGEDAIRQCRFASSEKTG
jgi:hypothetical protein